MARSALGVVLVAWLGLACAPHPPARGLVLVTLDTVRADHLGCYGYPRDTSPTLDAFAQHATRYTRALASSPWTLPTHASLFTGLYPFEHGAHTFKLGPGRSVANPLDEARVTLAEVLRDDGFGTAAFVANRGYLAERYRLDQGFDVYQVAAGSAQEQVARAGDWLDVHAGEPFFLFLNFMDAHSPYNTTPQPDALDPAPEPAETALIRRRDAARSIRALYAAVMPGDQPVPRDLVQRVIGLYDAGITNADRGLEDLFEHLRQLGLYDEVLIVVTSDHGEYFGEHGLVEHSKDVYQPVLWIPLVVKAPGQRSGRVVEQPISSVDVPGLVGSLLGGEPGQRLAARFPARGAPLLAENYYTRLRDFSHPVWGDRFDRVRRAVYDGRYKLVHSSDGRHELYDLAEDPEERRDLSASRPELVQRLVQVLGEELGDAPERGLLPGAAEPAGGEREALRELGYLEP